MNERIMFLDYDETEDEWIVTLHDGYHYAGKHIFTAKTKDEIREKMYNVKPCICNDCLYVYPKIKKILSQNNIINPYGISKTKL